MMEFKIGDKVQVFWDRDDALTGTLMRMPNDTGDTWQIVDSLGRLHAINPNCSSLIEIVRIS
jgi:hypothetical protein